MYYQQASAPKPQWPQILCFKRIGLHHLWSLLLSSHFTGHFLIDIWSSFERAGALKNTLAFRVFKSCSRFSKANQWNGFPPNYNMLKYVGLWRCYSEWKYRQLFNEEHIIIIIITYSFELCYVGLCDECYSRLSFCKLFHKFSYRSCSVRHQQWSFLFSSRSQLSKTQRSQSVIWVLAVTSLVQGFEVLTLSPWLMTSQATDGRLLEYTATSLTHSSECSVRFTLILVSTILTMCLTQSDKPILKCS